MSGSLDDFFAKKDKKKKAGKAKLTNNDLVNTEEVKEVKKLKKKTKESEAKEAANSALPASEQTPAPEPSEEWSEYVEEKETDYSGLRIQAIQIRDEDGNEQTDKAKDKDPDCSDDEDDEGADAAASGVWSAVAHQNQPKETKQPEPVEPPPKKEEPAPAPAARGGYVIPSKRSGASGATLDPMPSRQMRRKREAPNLKSEEDFPTLGGGPPDDGGGAWGSGRFEKVRSGARVEEQSSRGQRVELGNKYDVLRGGGD